jgi:chloramphenicol-sensitive protein RarD
MTTPAPTDSTTPESLRRGLLAGFGAFAVWGLAPVYWKLLDHVDSLETVCHRTVWSAVFMLAIVWARGLGGQVRAAFADPQTLLRLTCSALLIAGNWFLYIYSVVNDRILEASLGYFTNPIVSVLLGMTFLGETLTRRRRWAVVLAVVAVVILTVRAGSVPWIAVLLASSFGLYGLLRKTVGVAGGVGLTVEAILLSPMCLAFLGWRGFQGTGAFTPTQPRDAVLLALTGVLTAVPLWWFADAARRLPLSTVGMLQYLAPSLQFLLAVLVYREPFDTVRLLAFSLIWAACALFSWPRQTPPAIPVRLQP